MMPWEHVAIGYVGFSLFVHAVYRDSPTAEETLVVGFASLLPDLIDKPLDWTFDVVSTGYAIGHSVLFAVPLTIVVGTLAFTRGRPRTGAAFGIGYLLHLPADVLPPYLRGGTLAIGRVLWPVRSYDRGSESFGEWFVDGFLPYLRAVVELEASPYAYGALAVVLASTLLWIYDGMPVVREAYRRYWFGDQPERTG